MPWIVPFLSGIAFALVVDAIAFFSLADPIGALYCAVL